RGALRWRASAARPERHIARPTWAEWAHVPGEARDRDNAAAPPPLAHRGRRMAMSGLRTPPRDRSESRHQQIRFWIDHLLIASYTDDCRSRSAISEQQVLGRPHDEAQAGW